MRFWNEERLGQLKQFIAEDKSFREIALIMGVSRSAIAGASHRELGGGGAVVSVQWTDAEREILRSLANARKSVREICETMGKGRNGVEKQLRKMGLRARRVEFSICNTPREKTGPTMLPKERTEPQTALPFLGLNIVTIKPSQCRYPHGDGPFLFCGQPTDGEVNYCAFHQTLCHGVSYASRNRTEPKDKADLGRQVHRPNIRGRVFRTWAEWRAFRDSGQTGGAHAAGNRRGDAQDHSDDESGPLTFRPIGEAANEIVDRLA